MGFVQRLARVVGRGTSEQKSIGLTDPEALTLFGAIPSASGVHVSAATAMRAPSVRRAVVLISEACGTVPFKLFEHETREAAKDHPAFALVHREANPWTSAEALREQMTVDALLSGHGFGQIVRVAGRPVELHRMDPGAVSIEHDDFGEPSYRVRLKHGGDVVLGHADVLHLSALGGVSPVVHAREAIALCIAAESHLAGFYRNGGRPSGVILHPNKLDVETTKKLAASWFTSHSGEQAGSTAVLDEGMSFHEIAMKLADAEFSEVRREQVREVGRAFNVPPALLYETSRATWSNFEQSHRDFLTGTLRPWLARWQAAYAHALLTPEERGRLYVEAVADDLLSVEFSARATALSQYRAMGALTANEVRGMLNRAPLPGGDDLTNPFVQSGAAAPAPNEEPTE